MFSIKHYENMCLKCYRLLLSGNFINTMIFQEERKYKTKERCKNIGMIVRATSIKLEILKNSFNIHFHWNHNDTMNL